VLPAGTAAPGASLVQALPATQDTVLEIDLTPNRPDALGHVGLAREAAALFGVPFAPGVGEPPERSREEDLAKDVAISIQDAERCPHYAASVLIDAAIGPTPLALRWRLWALGVRAVSNVVDVTNIVMLEFIALRAFDLDKCKGAIVVRRARAGERLRTSTGSPLAVGAPVICDGGGRCWRASWGGTARSAATRRVLLQGRASNRAASGVSLAVTRCTESSHRFERGVDWGALGRPRRPPPRL
jgi:phenylalanyl-tRNA synthetase beta chain